MLTCAAEYMKTSKESSMYDCKYTGTKWSLSFTAYLWMYSLHIEMFERRFERQKKKKEKK